MLRELQVTINKPANSMLSAKVAVKTGMAVVKNQADGTFKLPTAATATDLFVVDKERVATGYKAGVANLSDYDEEFVNVKAGEKAKLIAYYAGERIASDQFKNLAGLNVGDRLVAGADGLWAKATSGTTSKYVFGGKYMDANAHELGIIEVSDTAQ